MQSPPHMVHKWFQYNKTGMEQNNEFFAHSLQQQEFGHEVEHFG
jgi:hypothetical protein